MELSGSTREIVAGLSGWLAAKDDEPLVVETSGSSGRPKRVVLSRSAVLASGAATVERLGAAGPWLLALPASYVAGAQVVCRSLAAGHDPVLLEEHPSLADAVAAMPDGPRFASLVPTQLHRMLDDPAAVPALRTLHTVLLGGGPIDVAVRERATALGIRTVATYGSAETAGGCVYDGVPLDGVEVLVDEHINRIRIGGPTLFTAYEGEPERTHRVLNKGRFATEDAGVVEDGRLRVLGRLDDMVVSGGLNIPAAAVAARLREHPRVVVAEVLGVPDQEWGHRLVAFVVGDLDLTDLREWVAAVHPRAWAPRQLVVLPALPLLPNGKPDRLRLRALA